MIRYLFYGMKNDNFECFLYQIASVEAVKEVLAEWDVAETDKLLQKLEAEKQKRKEEQQMRRDAETSK